jgi:hypothetical protein
MKLPNIKGDEAPANRQEEAERAFTVQEFCEIERMTLATYNKLRKSGYGPSEVRFPGMLFIRITAQARREWHAKTEEWRKDAKLQMELRRRAEQASAAGKLSASKPQHISQRRAAAAKKRAAKR